MSGFFSSSVYIFKVIMILNISTKYNDTGFQVNTLFKIFLKHPQCYMPMSRVVDHLALKKIFEVFFYLIWTPFLSCDLDNIVIFTFSHLMDAPSEV